ncbi:MAG: hypothetical protein AB7F88_15200 [Pyrinomonadaceae bacterium]
MKYDFSSHLVPASRPDLGTTPCFPENVAHSAGAVIRFAFGLGIVLILSIAAFGSPQSMSGSDENTLVVESSPDMEIISFSKNVVVKREAKGVLVFGADVIIEGRVEGDVAAVGGSIIQREGAYVGGDIIVLGGKYSPDSINPLRGESKQTVTFAAYEEEFREFARDPLSLFSPTLSLSFVALRVTSLLFWFVLSLGFTTIAPGAVGRAVARFKLSSAKVIAIGLFTFVGANVLLFAALTALPNSINAVLIGMAMLTVTLAYVFGRVALHVSAGKLLQKHFLSDQNRSETLSVFLGTLLWTVVLSIPYLWIFALLALLSAGIGLVLTARPTIAVQTR